jgi:hypothetical protein
MTKLSVSNKMFDSKYLTLIHRALLFGSVWIVFLVFVSPASAQTIVENQALTFGKIVMSDLNTVSTVTVNPAGSYTVDPTTYIMEDPENGDYDLVGGPPSTAYTLTFPPAVGLVGPGVSNFTVDNFTILPASLTTDLSGDVGFRLGARLRSSGSGLPYSDGNYSGTIDINISY